MPLKDFLTLKQVKQLQQALKTDECPHFREHILIMLLLNDGKTHQEVAKFLGCASRTVDYWFIQGDPDNLESFRDQREKGNFRKATPEYINILMEVIEKEPSEFGYEFGRWTGERLAVYLEKETGIRLSGGQIRRIIKRKKYSYIWAKYSLEEKQDPEKRQEFCQKWSNYLKLMKEKPGYYQIWFWDESGFSLRVLRRKTWTRKGKRKKVSGVRRRGRVNVMGGLRYQDKKCLCYFVKKGTGDHFFAQLSNLYNFVKKEWVRQGNIEEDFAQCGPKIIMILDNASWHKRKDIKEKIEQELPNLILEYLPAYSPDYNLIELVWHSAKEYLAGKLFKSVEELQNLLDKLLNEGELKIQWGRKLKNKGDNVNAN